MKRTVSIPVDLPSERFLPLMNQCAEIFNAHVDWAIANSTYNKNKAHKELYHLLRVQFPSVPSALLQTVRDNALEAIKATKFKSIPKKKPTCGHRTHADLNAAKNVRDDYILSSTQGTEEQASVNMPDVSTDSFGQLRATSPCGWGG